ncbi:MAG: hypothetical protein MUP28_01925 [Candidatus Aminicenantes bacterium]|nr:hypothetical protein [Candidatus Aminicenantes bacterium]
MHIFKPKPWMGLLFSLALIFGLCVSSTAQERIKISGKGTYAYTERPTIAFDDVEGHMILISKWEGMNWSTGEHKFMDRAEVSFISCADYIKGNGPFWGYIKMSQNGDVVYSKFKGKATTTLSPKGKPIMTLEGEMELVRGTGQYIGIQGSSKFKNQMISSIIMMSEWEGEYYIKK